MEQYISKSALVAEVKRLLAFYSKEIEDNKEDPWAMDIAKRDLLQEILSFLDTIEVIDPYEQCIQYASIESGIKAHAEEYSFNIESELFHQLTKEQQKLWRKEIEQACISGGEMGVELAKDTRYKENHEVKEVDLENIIKEEYLKRRCYGGKENMFVILNEPQFNNIAKHFFELGLKAQKGE